MGGKTSGLAPRKASAPTPELQEPRKFCGAGIRTVEARRFQKNEEGFAEKHGGKMRASTSYPLTSSQYSQKTVETHRRNIMLKTNCRSAGELVRYAIRNGIIEA